MLLTYVLNCYLPFLHHQIRIPIFISVLLCIFGSEPGSVIHSPPSLIMMSVQPHYRYKKISRIIGMNNAK